MTLKLPDSGAETTPDGRRHAPSAARNAAPILELLREVMPASGLLLELASGTGQHAAEFAAALPGLTWQPTDINPENMASIRAWTGNTTLPPAILDATRKGWSTAWPCDALLAVNLLHLIPTAAAEILLTEAALALRPNGTGLIYGPFLRNGMPTSEGDAAFHSSLQAQDPTIGYKDLAWVTHHLATAGLQITTRDMPANNLSLIFTKPA